MFFTALANQGHVPTSLPQNGPTRCIQPPLTLGALKQEPEMCVRLWPVIYSFQLQFGPISIFLKSSFLERFLLSYIAVFVTFQGCRCAC